MHIRNPSTPRRQHGFSLLEIGIVLVIIAVIVAVVLARGASTSAASNAANETQDVIGIIGDLTGLKAAGTYGPAGTNLVPTVITENDVPGDWSSSGGTTLTNNAGGAVTAVSNGNTYTLTSGNYTAQECVHVAQGVSESGAVTTSINGGAGVTGALMAAAATTGCKSATNSIAWTSLN